MEQALKPRKNVAPWRWRGFRQLGLKGQRQRCREGDGAYQEPQGDLPGGRERMLEGLV